MVTERRSASPPHGVLVVGYGFLGQRIATALAAQGRAVRVLTGSPPRTATAGLPIVIGDAADHPAVVEAIDGCDAVVWCAGRLLPASTVQDLAEIDDVGPLHTVLTELGERQGRRRFIYLSSGGTVYGNAVRVPTPESEPLRPVNIYGATKVRCEHYVQELSLAMDLDAVVLRCANVYGPGQRAGRTQGVIASAFACQQAGRLLTLFADAWSLRDYIYVDDVVRVVQASLDTMPPNVMNVATGIGTPLIELIDKIRSLTGGPDVVSVPPRDCDVADNVLDISRLRAFMPDFDPLPLERGLELCAQQLGALARE